MKSRILWAAILLAAMAGFYFVTIRPATTLSPRRIKLPPTSELRPPEVTLPPLPMPTIETPTLTPPPLPPMQIGRPIAPKPALPEVPIQDGTTLDFSFGAPMVRSQGSDAEALEKALKEMAEATKSTTFPGKK